MDTELPLDLYAAIRWLGYLALFAVIGAVVFRRLVARALGADDPAAARLIRSARRIGVVGAAILLIASVLRLYFQARSALDPGDPFTRETVTNWFGGISSWGGRWAIQVAAAAGALAAFLLAGRARAAWALAELMVLASVISAPLTGHAIEHEWGLAGGVAMHGLHLAGGGVWLGTLFVLLVSTLSGTRAPHRDDRERVVAAVVNAYSPIALIGAGVAAALGVALAWLSLGSVPALWTTLYGRDLLVKLGLLAGVAALGAYNWRRVRPALGAAPGAARLRRSATAELVIGALLLAATAVLVALPAPAL